MNIKHFLAALCAAAFFVSCAGEKTTVLFNGKDLSGWKVVLKSVEGETFNGETFSVRDSVLHVTGKPFGYLRTEKKYSDYRLHLEWR